MHQKASDWKNTRPLTHSTEFKIQQKRAEVNVSSYQVSVTHMCGRRAESERRGSTANCDWRLPLSNETNQTPAKNHRIIITVITVRLSYFTKQETFSAAFQIYSVKFFMLNRQIFGSL